MTFQEILDKVAERAGKQEECRLHRILARANDEAGSIGGLLNSRSLFISSQFNYAAHIEDAKTEAVNRVVDKIFGLADA
jgi:hypothetical protein